MVLVTIDSTVVLNDKTAAAFVAVAFAESSKDVSVIIDKIVALAGTPVNSATVIPTTSPVVDPATVTVASVLVRPQVRLLTVEIPVPLTTCPTTITVVDAAVTVVLL